MKDLIGFFDSGVGGISVLCAAKKLLPNENFLFYGDNAHAPYGPRPLEEIRALSAAGLEVLFKREVKAIVIACNTATSAYAEIVRSAHPEMPIIGMEPALKPAHFARHGGKVIVLATAATLKLEKFNRLMALYGEDAIPVIGEGLVELVERGQSDSKEAARQVQKVLLPYRNQPIDAVVLGCTHYPFLRRHVQSVFPEAAIFDGREGTAQRLKSQLETYRLRSDDAPGTVEYQTSGGEEIIALMKRLATSI